MHVFEYVCIYICVYIGVDALRKFKLPNMRPYRYPKKSSGSPKKLYNTPATPPRCPQEQLKKLHDAQEAPKRSPQTQTLDPR